MNCTFGFHSNWYMFIPILPSLFVCFLIKIFIFQWLIPLSVHLLVFKKCAQKPYISGIIPAPLYAHIRPWINYHSKASREDCEVVNITKFVFWTQVLVASGVCRAGWATIYLYRHITWAIIHDVMKPSWIILKSVIVRWICGQKQARQQTKQDR